MDRISSAINDCYQPVNDCTLAVAFLHQTAFNVWVVDFQVEEHRARTYLTTYKFTRRYTQEYRKLNIHHRDIFKSRLIVFLLYKLEKLRNKITRSANNFPLKVLFFISISGITVSLYQR